MKHLQIVLLFIFVLIGQSIFAQDKDYVPNLTQLIEQTQISSENSNKMSLLWWLPKEFWRSALADDPSFTEEGLTEFVELFENYTVLLVVEGQIGMFGNISYKSYNEIKNGIEIFDENFNVYTPIDESELPSDLVGMFSIWKPLFASMLGSMGENINYFVFQNNYNKEVLDAFSSDKFKIKVLDEEYSYRLPLGVLFPPKTCSKCDDEFMGSYNFCPYDGEKLK